MFICADLTFHRDISLNAPVRYPTLHYFVTEMYARVHISVNSSLPGAAYMRQWMGSALVHIMACRLFGAKPLSEPMLDYCKLDPWEQTSVKFESKYKTFHSRKCIWKDRQQNNNCYLRRNVRYFQWKLSWWCTLSRHWCSEEWNSALVWSCIVYFLLSFPEESTLGTLPRQYDRLRIRYLQTHFL